MADELVETVQRLGENQRERLLGQKRLCLAPHWWVTCLTRAS